MLSSSAERCPQAGKGVASQISCFEAALQWAQHYSAASQGRSPKEFIAKLGTVVEGSDESCFWLRLIEATKIPAAPTRTRLAKEAKELLLIFGASLATAKRNRANRKKAKRKVGGVDPLTALVTLGVDPLTASVTCRRYSVHPAIPIGSTA
jgi:hypothetical protein